MTFVITILQNPVKVLAQVPILESPANEPHRNDRYMFWTTRALTGTAFLATGSLVGEEAQEEEDGGKGLCTTHHTCHLHTQSTILENMYFE